MKHELLTFQGHPPRPLAIRNSVLGSMENQPLMSNLLKELDWQKQQADTLRTKVDRLRAALAEQWGSLEASRTGAPRRA